MREGKRIKAVIFDLDDTLIDWAKPSSTWKEFTKPKTGTIYSMLAREGHNLPDEEKFFDIIEEAIYETWEEAKRNWLIPSFSDVLQGVFLDLGLNLDNIEMDDLLRAYEWGPVPGVVLYPDTHDVLRKIRSRGYKIGLVTNSFLPMWMRDAELVAYDLMAYLDVRLSAADVGYLKPHPAIYRRALDLLDVSAEEAVFVGDRPQNDIAGANEVGIISVLMNPPHLQRDPDGIAPDYTIICLSELLTILRQLELKPVG